MRFDMEIHFLRSWKFIIPLKRIQCFVKIFIHLELFHLLSLYNHKLLEFLLGFYVIKEKYSLYSHSAFSPSGICLYAASFFLIFLNKIWCNQLPSFYWRIESTCQQFIHTKERPQSFFQRTLVNKNYHEDEGTEQTDQGECCGDLKQTQVKKQYYQL